MHTPITANGGIYCERTNGDITRLAGADSASTSADSSDTGSGSGSSSSSSSSSSPGSRGAEARTGLKGPRRKPNGTAEDQAHKRKPGRPTRRKGKKPPGVLNAIAALLVRNQIRRFLCFFFTFFFLFFIFSFSFFFFFSSFFLFFIFFFHSFFPFLPLTLPLSLCFVSPTELMLDGQACPLVLSSRWRQHTHCGPI